MTRRILALAGLLGLLLLPRPAAAQQSAADQPPKVCAVPRALALPALSLPAAKAALARRRALVVMALGSAPTLGAAADGAAYSYPSRLEVHLARLLPGIAVSVLNKGAARRSTHGMATHLAHALAESGAHLVIWEAGGREAARGMDVDSFASDLQVGLDEIHAAGADVILMDLQYAPGMPHLVPVDAYRQAIQDAASNSRDPIFRRYDLMTAWATQGLDLSAAAPAHRVAVARTLYDCLASTLATAIARAVR